MPTFKKVEFLRHVVLKAVHEAAVFDHPLENRLPQNDIDPLAETRPDIPPDVRRLINDIYRDARRFIILLRTASTLVFLTHL